MGEAAQRHDRRADFDGAWDESFTDSSPGMGTGEAGRARWCERGSRRLPSHFPVLAVLPIEAAVDLQLLYPTRIGVEDFDLERTGARDELAPHRHAADPGRDVSGERVHLLRDFAHVKFATDDRCDVLQAGAGIGQERAVGLANHARRILLVVLVGDLTHDLLDDILDRHHAVGAAIFIDHEGEMDAGRLHLGKQVQHRHGRRRVKDFAHDLRRRQRHRKVNGLEVQAGGKRPLAPRVGLGARGGALGHECDEVTDVHHAASVVEGVVVDHKT